MNPIENKNYFTGRGTQINTHNRFLKTKYVAEHIEGLDEEFLSHTATEFIEETPKKVISVNDSPDIPFRYSVNPYQGCEHGCVYCYARNAHEYWGYGAGLDFERKILVKKTAPQILERQLSAKNYAPDVIMLSGNTDCYQPIERKLKLTRSILQILADYKHPVGIITKNSLILRDMDILKRLAENQLVSVAITINSLREELRRKMEPRTTTAQSRLQVIRQLSDAGIPVRLMCAPIIPGLNSDEIPELIKSAANHGASGASFTIVRLNGAIETLFKDWIYKAYPDRADKVLNQIAACHGGKLNDSRWGNRMRGDGHVANTIHQLFRVSLKQYMPNYEPMTLRTDLFTPKRGRQLELFSAI